MSIAKRTTARGEARYDVLYRGPDGRERSKTFRTRRDARDFEHDQRVAMRKGVWTDPRAGRITLEDWSAEWQRTIVHLAASSRRIHANNLRRHVVPDVVDAEGVVLVEGLGSVELGKLTTAQLRGWVAALGSKPRRPGSKSTATLAPATVHQAYRTLHQCLEAAVSDGRMPRNPLDGVKPPKVHAKPMRFLTAEEVDELADAMPERYRALVYVAAYCGLRPGELLALRWENVDLLARQVRVVEQTDVDAGPGAVKPPKTAAGRRAVSVPRFVVAELERHGSATRGDDDDEAPRNSNEGKRGAVDDGADVVALPVRGASSQRLGHDWSGLVFTAADGAQLDRHKLRDNVWLKAVRAAGLEPLRIHDMRHTCASLAIRAGADVKALQGMLGHASAAMTLDRYGHLMPGQAEAVADRLDVLRETARKGA